RNWGVSDDHNLPTLCPRIFVLVPGKQVACFSGGTAQPGQYTNVGTVTAQSVLTGTAVTASDPSNYFGVQGGIDIEKSTNGVDADAAPGPFIPVGSPVTWTYRVTNTGNSDLTNVGVVDFQSVAVSCPQTTLAAGAFMDCTGSGISIPGQYA